MIENYIRPYLQAPPEYFHNPSVTVLLDWPLNVARVTCFIYQRVENEIEILATRVVCPGNYRVSLTIEAEYRNRGLAYELRAFDVSDRRIAAAGGLIDALGPGETLQLVQDFET